MRFPILLLTSVISFISLLGVLVTLLSPALGAHILLPLAVMGTFG